MANTPYYTKAETEARLQSGNYVGADIDIWGDSLTAQIWSDKLALLTGRNVFANGFSGKKSHYIRDQFLASTNKDRTQIFWVGRNNYSEPDAIIDDLRIMVEALNHRRFLIMMPPNGGYTYEFQGAAGYNYFEQISKRLQASYPDNFIDNRNAIIEYYDMGGVTLVASFAQPAIGENIQITVSDTAFLSTENASDASNFTSDSGKIRIGNLTTSDLYEIISVDSATLMTVQLIESNLFSVGATVDNTNVEGSIKYLKVIQQLDYKMWQNNTTLSSMRSDSIHMNNKGKELISKIVSRSLETKKI